ncbi:hypothetical protein [Burkholderia phage BCSR5]|nr:hypothetical protein [Burkholderia phage BCSR5]
MRIEAAKRLKADTNPDELIVGDERIDKIKDAMHLIDRTMKVPMEELDGAHVLVEFQGKAEADLGAADLRRLETVVSMTKARFSIRCEGGKLVYTFELDRH